MNLIPVPYSPYFNHLKGYIDNSADNNKIHIVSFEDMKEDPAATVTTIAKFLKVDVTESEVAHVVALTSFDAMKANSRANYEHWDDLGLRNKKEEPFMRKGSNIKKKYYADVLSVVYSKFTTFSRDPIF